MRRLTNGDFAIAIVNRNETTQDSKINFVDLGLNETYEIKNLWQHKVIGKGKRWSGNVQRHETKLFRLKNI